MKTILNLYTVRPSYGAPLPFGNKSCMKSPTKSKHYSTFSSDFQLAADKQKTSSILVSTHMQPALSRHPLNAMRTLPAALVTVLAFLLISPTEAACGAHKQGREVSELIETQYKHLYRYARRGVPDSILLRFFRNYITLLKEHVKTQSQNTNDQKLTFMMSAASSTILSEPFGTQCVSDMYVTILEFGSATKMLELAIMDMLLLDDKLFYLGDMFSDKELLVLSTDEQKMVEGIWYNITVKLTKPLDQIDVDEVAQLPKTVKFFYDPNKEAVAEKITSLKNDKSSDNFYTTAEELVTQVLAMVLRMEFLGVERSESLQLLEHCAKFVFNNVRAKRSEGKNLSVLTVHIPFYQDAFKTLTAKMNITRVPEIPAKVLQKHLPNGIERFSSFNSWGKLTKFTFSVFTVTMIPIDEQIFTPSILEAIASDIGISYSQAQSPSPLHTFAPSSRRLALNSTSQHVPGGQCNNDLYYHLPRWPIPSTSLQCCCPYICMNIHLLLTVQVESPMDCCGFCNQAYCANNESNPVSELAVIHLDPYGYFPASTFRIMI